MGCQFGQERCKCGGGTVSAPSRKVKFYFMVAHKIIQGFSFISIQFCFLFLAHFQEFNEGKRKAFLPTLTATEKLK